MCECFRPPQRLLMLPDIRGHTLQSVRVGVGVSDIWIITINVTLYESTDLGKSKNYGYRLNLLDQRNYIGSAPTTTMRSLPIHVESECH